MPADWNEVQLGEVADLLTGYPFKSQYYTDDVNDPRLIGGDNIVQGSLRWDNVRRWPRTLVDGLDEYWLKPGDVVLAMDRPWIEAGLKRAAIGQHDVPALLIQRTARIRGTIKLDTGFLRYVIGSQNFTNYVLGVQTGTAVPHISPGQVRAFRFSLPPLSLQRSIADILKTLDDKIELNHRMNETLEAMARALFKSWFVDFDPVRAKVAGRQPSGMDAETAKLFPSRFVQSELGEVPEGWGVGSLTDYALLNSETWNNSTRPAVVTYVDLSNTKWGKIEAVTNYPADQAPSRAQRILRTGDTIVGTVRPGNGSYALITENGLTGSTGFAVLRPHGPEHTAYVYLAATAPENIDRLSHLADGGAYPAVRSEIVAATEIVKPGIKLLTRFETVIGSLYQRIARNNQETRTLFQTRDALLPKLLSGELSVGSAERGMGVSV